MQDARDTLTGNAHVATVSFLAARAAPSFGFWVALAGGLALARAALRRGLRAGYGASAAAMLETVAIMGPARFSIPLTQAVTAPMMGRLEGRGVRAFGQFLACSAVRFVLSVAGTAFFVFVILGGFDAYAGSYNWFLRLLPGSPDGTGVVLALTALSIVSWVVFASAVQTVVYRRGLRLWRFGVGGGGPAAGCPPSAALREHAPGGHPRRAVAHRSPARFDPRAIAGAAAIAFAVLLASTRWPVLAGVALWLAVAWAVSPREPDVIRTGLVFAVLLGVGAVVAGLVSGLGADVAVRRGVRALLLVGVATWLRSAAGENGLRTVFHRSLWRLRRVPGAVEAAGVLDELDSGRRLQSAGRSLLDSLRGVRRRPVPVTDAIVGWVMRESAHYEAGAVAPVRLAVRWRDGALVAVAAAPLALLFGG